MESEDKARLAALAAGDKKASDVTILDVQGKCNFADYFVICTGFSNLQLRAISDIVEGELKKAGTTPLSPAQGGGKATWIVIDYGDVVVHVMSEEARSYYALENLWGDARIVPLGARSEAMRPPAEL